MTTVPHDVSPERQERRWAEQLRLPELWAAVAIVAMWAAVLFAAIFGPDIVSTNGTPGASSTSTTVPSAVAVALFAFLATWVVARYAFRRPRDDD